MSNKTMAALMRRAKVDPMDCYQCGKCAAGCPMANSMDLNSRQIMHCTQLGEAAYNKLISSEAIWLCTGCNVCHERCPHDVDIPSVIEQARYDAIEKGKIRRKSKIFNDIFLTNLKLTGKSQEAFLALIYNIVSLDIFQDMNSVPHMLRHKLVSVLPEFTKNQKEVSATMEKSKEWGKAEK